MGFTKQKTITVSAEDFLDSNHVCHAEFEHNGKHYLVQVVPDIDLFSPREGDHHEWKWTTGRNAGYSARGAMSIDAWHGMKKAEREKYLAYPLGLLRHSGDTLYVGSKEHWADPGGWDSGCMGVAYIEKKKAARAWDGTLKNGEIVKQGTRLTKKVRKEALECLKAEVKEMNMYLRGEVYGVIVTCLETEADDSCWGFYCDGRGEIEQAVRRVLPKGMTAEEKNAVIEALDWEW
jgi:hypothetical protein